MCGRAPPEPPPPCRARHWRSHRLRFPRPSQRPCPSRRCRRRATQSPQTRRWRRQTAQPHDPRLPTSRSARPPRSGCRGCRGSGGREHARSGSWVWRSPGLLLSGLSSARHTASRLSGLNARVTAALAPAEPAHRTRAAGLDPDRSSFCRALQPDRFPPAHVPGNAQPQRAAPALDPDASCVPR